MQISMDGADHYGTDATGAANMLKGIYAQSQIPPSTVRPRNGTHSFRTTSTATGGVNRRVLPSVRSELIFGAAYYFGTLPTFSGVVFPLSWRSNLNVAMMTITISTTGEIEVRAGGPGGSIVGVSDPIWTASEFNHLESKAIFAGAAGAVEVRRNGVTVISETGINIGAAATAAQFAYGTVPGATGIAEFNVDDTQWRDTSGSECNDFCGDKKVIFLPLNGDQVAQDWTPATGAFGYAMIDEAAPDDDASYVSSTIAGDISEYDFTNLPADIIAVDAITTYSMAKKTDSGSGSAQVSVLSAAADAPGADNAIGESYQYYTDTFSQDPDSAAPWTVSAVNAARIRLERTL